MYTRKKKNSHSDYFIFAILQTTTTQSRLQTTAVTSQGINKIKHVGTPPYKFRR